MYLYEYILLYIHRISTYVYRLFHILIKCYWISYNYTDVLYTYTYKIHVYMIRKPCRYTYELHILIQGVKLYISTLIMPYTYIETIEPKYPNHSAGRIYNKLIRNYNKKI